MRIYAVTAFLSFSLAILAVPVPDAEADLQDISAAGARHQRDAIAMALIEPLDARSQQVDTDIGPVGRSIVDKEGPIKARGRVNTSTGRPKREAEAVTEDEALETRGRFGSKAERAIGFPAVGSTSDSSDSGGSTGRRRDAEPIKFNSCSGHRRDTDVDTGGDSYRREAKPIKIPVGSGCRRDDLIERDPGLIRHPGGSPKRDLTPSYSGSYRREAEPIRISNSRGGHRREAEPIAQSMKNPGGGPKRRDAAAQPGRLDIGKGHDRRDADPGFVRPGGGTRPRDAIPGIVRPFGGTRVPRGIRGSGANPRGVRPGNGNNQRDVTAEAVEARGRFRGNSRLV